MHKIDANKIILIWNNHFETLKIMKILKTNSMKKKSNEDE